MTQRKDRRRSLFFFLCLLSHTRCSFINVINDALGDASLPELNSIDLPFNCSTWPELIVGDAIGHGRVREAHAATFRGESVVLKVPLGRWMAPTAERIAVFESEVGRWLRLGLSQHTGVPRLYGFCLNDSLGVGIGVVCERMAPLPTVELASLTWRTRVRLAISAASMVEQWRHYVDYRGNLNPRWFWDFSAANVGVDLAKRRVAVIDVESFTPYVVVREHHDASQHCKRHEQCMPRRLAKFHSALEWNVTELQCDFESKQCNGVLDDRTNVYRLCHIVLEPLFTHQSVPRTAFAAVDSILRDCLNANQDQRLTSEQLVQRLELLPDRL
jgi:hypothetical protein